MVEPFQYAYPLRYLARVYFNSPPTISGTKAATELARAAGTEDLEVEPINQVSLASGLISKGMSLVLPGADSRITAGRESIDFMHTPRAVGGETHLSHEEFISKAAAILATALRLSTTRATRLAIVAEGLLPEPVGGKDAVARALLRFPNEFEPAPVEWDWRCVSRVTRQVNGRTEETNNILAVKRTSGQIVGGDEFDSIRFDVDVNTVPTNAEERFGPDDAREFFMSARRWQVELWQSMSRFLERSR
jgi:hypothetical protein